MHTPSTQARPSIYYRYEVFAPWLPSAHAVDREYTVIKALHGTGFPVPRPFVLCTDDSVLGTMFYVMEMVEGRVLWEMTLPEMAPAERAAASSEASKKVSRGACAANAARMRRDGNRR
jgi:aminoglycoside phosphotransferase (APT) family kinase protein